MRLCKINRIFAKILENLTVDFSRQKGFLFFQLTERRDFAIIIKLYMDKEHPSYQQLFQVSRPICDIQIVNLL